MNVQQFIELLNIGKQIAIENEEMLCDLDSKNGDGDLGITFRKIMTSLNETVTKQQFNDLGKLLYIAGGDITENAASTMGTLFASGIMEAGKQLKGIDELKNEEFIILFQALIDGIEKRGKATRGDKTILDTLYPVVEALTKHVQDTEQQLFEHALVAAKNGVEATKTLEAKHGRAARYENKSVGLVDPGSVLAELLVSIFDKYYKQFS